MPVINCPECGGNVSDAAPACPHCGHPMGPATPLAHPPGSDKDRRSRKRYPNLGDPPPPPPEHWTATHLIPEGRLVARDVPNANAPGLFRSQALVEVQVVETNGVWARIVTEDGWTAWVDARRLVKVRR